MTGTVAPEHLDGPLLNADVAGDQGEEGGLAGAVGSDEAENAVARHLQIDAPEGETIAVAMAQPGDSQDPFAPAVVHRSLLSKTQIAARRKTTPWPKQARAARTPLARSGWRS